MIKLHEVLRLIVADLISLHLFVIIATHLGNISSLFNSPTRNSRTFLAQLPSVEPFKSKNLGVKLKITIKKMSN